MSGVQLSCQHKTGKLEVFLQFAAINTPPPHKGSQKTLFMGREVQRHGRLELLGVAALRALLERRYGC
jgi:hypothetical protein